MTLRRRLLPALAAAVLAGSLSACTSSLAGTVADPRVVRIVAAENTWGALATEIAGVHGSVTSLISNPNADPHSYEPTAADAVAVAEAQVVVVNGLGYDPWASQLAAASGVPQEVCEVGSVVGLVAGDNPHRWYDVADLVTVAHALAVLLGKADPTDSAYFSARATSFTTTGLAPLRAAIAEVRRRDPATPIAASESIVVPLVQSLGLRLLTPPRFLQSVAEGGDPASADLALIDQQLRDRRVAVYLLNRQNETPAVTSQVQTARAAGIPVVAWTETLEPVHQRLETWLLSEVRALQGALDRSRTR